ncbi:MAG: flavodoxin domain-containing protein [Bacteroidales bacterium]|nr:flavodoxin domain-containing protein [Bacteroidales bacterium]
MKKAVVIYQSKTGITKKFAEAIGAYAAEKGIDVQTLSIAEYTSGIAEKADYVFLGCWTSGFLLFFLQHPDGPWKQFAAGLPALSGKVALFTTYKVATGSMFNSMRKHLRMDASKPVVELRSRNGSISEEHKVALDAFLK